MRTFLLTALLLAGCTSAPADHDVRIQDIHGLALHPEHPGKLYVATHHGLFVAENDSAWKAVTEQPFDMMGFTMHPRDGHIMYASGHPGAAGQGWAVGVVKSTDGGRTWTTLGLKDQVDFHAMAMEAGANAQTDTVYGFHGGRLHVSQDGARTWRTHTPPAPIAALAVAPTGHVLAATGSGLYQTARAAAGDWQRVADHASTAVATREKMIVAYFDRSGLQRSMDGGATWSVMNWTVPAGDYPWGIALGSDVVYVGTARGTIHKSSDQGASWARIK